MQTVYNQNQMYFERQLKDYETKELEFQRNHENLIQKLNEDAAKKEMEIEELRKKQ